MTRTTAQRAADAKKRGDFREAARLYLSASLAADHPYLRERYRAAEEECDWLDCKADLDA